MDSLILGRKSAKIPTLAWIRPLLNLLGYNFVVSAFFVEKFSFYWDEVIVRVYHFFYRCLTLLLSITNIEKVNIQKGFTTVNSMQRKTMSQSRQKQTNVYFLDFQLKHLTSRTYLITLNMNEV